MGTQKIFSILTQADQSYCQHSSKHAINFDTFFMVVVNVFCIDFQLRDLTQVIVKEYFTLINGPINEVCVFLILLCKW